MEGAVDQFSQFGAQLGGKPFGFIERDPQRGELLQVAAPGALRVRFDFGDPRLRSDQHAVGAPVGRSQINQPRLARFEIPRYLRFAEAPLPRTASGKILKRQLREEAVTALA